MARTARSESRDLIATFNSRGVATTVLRGLDGAVDVARPATTPNGYIVPFGGTGQTFCDDEVVGTWVSVFNDLPAPHDGREPLEDVIVTFTLDGAPLDTRRTSIRAFIPVHGEEPYPGFTEGDPEMGTLPIGEHTLVLRVEVPEIDFTLTFTTEFTVEEC